MERERQLDSGLIVVETQEEGDPRLDNYRQELTSELNSVDPTVTVTILDTETGELHVNERFPARWWHVGNGSCDCNRDPEAFKNGKNGGSYCLGCKRWVIVDCSDSGFDLEYLNQDYSPELVNQAKTYRATGYAKQN